MITPKPPMIKCPFCKNRTRLHVKCCSANYLAFSEDGPATKEQLKAAEKAER